MGAIENQLHVHIYWHNGWILQMLLGGSNLANIEIYKGWFERDIKQPYWFNIVY